MDKDPELLTQRVSKHRKKVEQAASVVSMTRERLASAETAEKESGRESRSLEASYADAKKKAKQLKHRALQAAQRAESAVADRVATERELTDGLHAHQKRQDKLAKAESESAALDAAQRVAEEPPPTTGGRSSSRKKSTTSRTTSSPRKAPVKKAPVKKKPAKKASSTGKKASSTGKKASSTRKKAASTTRKATPRKRAPRS